MTTSPDEPERDGDPRQRVTRASSHPAVTSSKVGPGIEGERARKVLEAAHALLHRVALAAPGQADHRRLLDRERFHLAYRSPCAWRRRTRRGRPRAAPSILSVFRPNAARHRTAPSEPSIDFATPSGSLLSAAVAHHADIVLAALPTVTRVAQSGRLQLGLDADRGEVLLHHLGRILVHAVLGRRQQRAGEAVRMAGLGQQLLGERPDRSCQPFSSSGLKNSLAFGIGRCARRRAAAEERGLDDLLALDRMRDGLAHARVVERRLRAVEDEVHEGPVDRVERQLRILARSPPSTATARIRSGRRRRPAAPRHAGSRRHRRPRGSPSASASPGL